MNRLPPQFLTLTPEQAQTIRMRCLAWVQEMDAKNMLQKPLPPEKALEVAKMVETWSFGGFAPVIKAVTPLGTVDDGIEAIRGIMREMIEGCGNAAKKERMRFALGSLERFAADVAQAIEMPS